MSPAPYTFLAVHAHPDDESSGTGGIFRLTAAQGHTTVLVTCTNGELGECKGPAVGLNPLENLDDRPRLAAVRRQELTQAASVLDITHLHMLGYHDSGMDGWETNTAPYAFVNADTDEAVGRLVKLIRHYRPHVVATYDEHGGYGHPDHIMAHRITIAALEAAAEGTRYPQHGHIWDVPKVYYTAWARSHMLRVFKVLHFFGRETPLRDADFDPTQWGCPDDLITTQVDVRPVMRTKWQALFTHRSQMEGNALYRWTMRLAARWLYPYESLRCIRGPQPIQSPESDIFSGLT